MNKKAKQPIIRTVVSLVGFLILLITCQSPIWGQTEQPLNNINSPAALAAKPTPPRSTPTPPTGRPIVRTVVGTPAKPFVLQGTAAKGKVINGGAAIVFKPFPMVDLKTNQPVAANATLTLPNGRKVSAGKYYDTLNKTEQNLNSMGLTLRGVKDLTVQVKPVLGPVFLQNQLGKIKVNPISTTFKKNQFEVKKKTADAILRGKAFFDKQNQDALNKKVQDKVDSVGGFHPELDPNYNNQGGGPPPSAALTTFRQPAAQFSGTDVPTPTVLGDPAYAAFTLSTKLKRNMSPLQAYFGVEGRLGITVLSKDIDPAVVSAGFRAPLIGEKGFTLSVKAPYGPTIPYNKPATGSLELKDEQGADINGEVRTTIVLGIIPVTFAAGVRGKVGIEYGVGITAYGSTPDNKPIDEEWYTKASQATVAKSTFGVGLRGHADVFANVTMYASAVAGGEVDLGLCTVGASLGAQTEITLFDGRMVFEVDALIEKPVDAKPHGKVAYSGNFNITSAMAGDLFIEAKLDFCIKTVKYRYYIWSDPGVHGKSYPLFSGEPEGDIF